MKRISYFLIVVVVIGVGAVSFWVYQKYFKIDGGQSATFTVERGTVNEIVKVRGEVVSEKDYNLGFLTSGTVKRVYVKEGDLVSQGRPLMKLDTTELEISANRLRAVLAQREANLKKLMAGYTLEDLNVARTEVSKATVTLDGAKKNLTDELSNAYTVADDAVRSKGDMLFFNVRSTSPQLIFDTTNIQLKTDAVTGRVAEEYLLSSWKGTLASGTFPDENLDTLVVAGKENLAKTRSFLDSLALAVNGAVITDKITQTTVDGWRTSIAMARTNVNAAITTLTAAEDKWNIAVADLALAKDELTLKEAGTRQEDIVLAKAQTAEAENNVKAAEFQIEQATLYASVPAKVNKIYLEEGEAFTAGNIALSLSASENKIQADVSELEIGKLEDTNGGIQVGIKLDAFPTEEFNGRLVNIEPKEIVKDGDKYYRVNVAIDPTDRQIRPGMSADLIIRVSVKNDVLKIPAFTIVKRDNGMFVKVVEGNTMRDAKIETGISDGEFTEVTSGLREGHTVTISAE